MEVASAPAADLTDLQAALLDWFGRSRRTLPWRDNPDPYAVLVSEIMLQQTQVDRVIPHFGAFLTRFPSPAALAAASVADVVTAWQGLGYNRRAVALHRAARAVVERHGGRIPDDLEALLALPGIGPYTARAVRCFAFGCDDGPVDTNVRRVLLRAVGRAGTSAREVQDAADAMVPAGRGRDWSAAVMDLGASLCTAARPGCERCPLRQVCAWARQGGPDPAAVVRRTPPQSFVGSTRWHRGRLLDALRLAPVARLDLAAAARTADAAAANAVAQGLVADGLAQWEGERLRLPR